MDTGAYRVDGLCIIGLTFSIISNTKVIMKTPAQLQVQMYHVFITKDMVAFYRAKNLITSIKF